MTEYVRVCPNCRSARPLSEIVCNNLREGTPCHWPIVELLPVPAYEADTTPAPAPIEQDGAPADVDSGVSPNRCRNGHDLAPGDLLCEICGEGPAESVGAEPATSRVPRILADEWPVEAQFGPIPDAEQYLVRRNCDHHPLLFKHYRRGIEPEIDLYSVLRGLDNDHGPRLLDAGRFEDRAYEVWEHFPLGSLAEIPMPERSQQEFVRSAASELGRALAALENAGVRHRNLKPGNIMVRGRQPLDLVLSDFSTAKLAEFDLQVAATGQATRYAAPEAIAGAFAASSDWWSLGVIVMELLTNGACFEGVHDRAFLLHLVTRGLQVPEELPADWRELLKGLLTRDPSKRWKWPEFERWLAGERGIPNAYDVGGQTAHAGPTIELGGNPYASPDALALAAADEPAWDEAKELILKGAVATWLEQLDVDAHQVAELRRVVADQQLNDDARVALALLVLNQNIPLCFRGEIVNPAWLLSHPARAIEWLRSSLPNHLLRLERENWLVRLRERADRVRSRVAEYDIPVTEDQLEVALLATSTSTLESRWQQKRRLFPEASHPGLGVLFERRAPSDEELIILISARLDALRPADDLLSEAQKLAREAGVQEFDVASARLWFERSRRDAFDTLNERLRGFARCGRERVDEWADALRLERRLSLTRALVLLAIPADQWREPPQQQYVRNVLTFFHRRLVANVQRGPLVRLLIGRSSARLDLHELGTAVKPGSQLLDAILSRQKAEVDPSVLIADPMREQRLRRLVQSAGIYRRDTGINALYMGFPLLLMRASRIGEGAKPRIAPVLLWPVTIEMGTGTRGRARIAFDRDRDEIRLNPAFESMLGSEETAKWRAAADEILARDSARAVDVLGVFATLAQADGRGLQPMPPADTRHGAGEKRLRSSAALFLCDFSGQTIAEDLKHIANRPLRDTALEVGIRAKVPNGETVQPAIPESDRYFTVEADPSQQAAVFQARNYPGLVIQGPPGTGKSQTIVNIISDCIGRGQRALVVCQKQAALEVVRKRLDAEGLGGRLFLLEDTVSDRRPALQSLREQLDSIWAGRRAARINQQRQDLARRVEALEAALNENHRALNDIDAETGLSYREVIERLLAVEAGDAPPMAVTGLRTILGSLKPGDIEKLSDEMSPLAQLWLDAAFEGSPLCDLRPFGADESVLESFRSAFSQLAGAERNREAVLAQHKSYYDIEAPELLQAWLSSHEAALRAISDPVARNVARWYELLRTAGSSEPPAARLTAALAESLARLEVLDPADYDGRLSPRLSEMTDQEIREWSKLVAMLLRPPSWLSGINVFRTLRRRRLRKFLEGFSLTPEAATLQALAQALTLEMALRPERAVLAGVRAKLSETPRRSETLIELRTAASDLLKAIKDGRDVVARIAAHPLGEIAAATARKGEVAAYASWLDACRASLRRFAARKQSATCLQGVGHWMKPGWLEGVLQDIVGDRTMTSKLSEMSGAFPTLQAYQRFRIRAEGLGETALRAFASMRAFQSAWRRMQVPSLPTEVRRTLWREALLAWKDRMENRTPALLVERAEFEEKVRTLEDLDHQLRQLNRKLLSAVPAEAPIASRNEWEDVYMLQGPRARRLREVVDLGERLGLYQVRPIWLCSPDMVSRLFALRAGMFDVVIFDEASQLPVESALPALYRAKRVVVSGDEKQMPPTNFFTARFDDDEEELDDNWLETDSGEMDEAARHQRAEAMNRKEVKDCNDLLELAKTLLPVATLEIHYRSKYRQLIAFSNSAFYSGKLSVPSQHPVSVVQRVRPIEVIRSDSEYVNQTNPGEAQRVVDLLQETWLEGSRVHRPSLGIVTFNLKQADLISQAIEERAEENADFRLALEQEAQRRQDGEDMSFFVKNLENVQGDERDWIVFSTTFGPDARRVFRRYFGAVGQQGGERRLNVAVTRAREKVVLVTSMPVAQVSTFIASRRRPHFARDFLQAYLDYAEKISKGELDLADNLLLTLSTDRQTQEMRNGEVNGRFRHEVGEFIAAHGFTPIAGSEIDAFALDFAIEHPSTGVFGIGIECDPPSHPLLAAARARELWRPRVLKSAVPHVHRVWSRSWYHNRAGEQRHLLKAIHTALQGSTS
jgi:hypothetical protein